MVTHMTQIATGLSYQFSIPSSWGISSIIEFHLDHFDPTLVDHLGYHLSACPIKHPFKPSVSWDSQDNII